MKDRSGWTDEQINEAVFKAKNPPNPREQRDYVDCGLDDYPEIPDYTHDWNLCGELFEEMPTDTSLWKSEYGWVVISGDEEMITAKTPCRALAEYYLKWTEWRRNERTGFYTI